MISQPLMTLQVTLASVEKVGAVPYGARTIVPVTGGVFEGRRLRGRVLSGEDWTLLRSDGVLELDLQLALQTDDGAVIAMRSFGYRHGPPDVIAALARGDTVDPATYYFRTTPRFEAAAPKYAFLNRMLAVASGDRRATGPIYSIDEIV